MDLVLVHGMGRTPLSLLLIRNHLQRLGHSPHLFGYIPALETLKHASARLARKIQLKTGGRPYALIGHSLGTVIIRNALPLLDAHPPAANFFLAPPTVACKAARFFSRLLPYRLITGEMGQLLAQASFMERLPCPENTRIYAGTKGPQHRGLPFGRTPNDGILSVAEATRMDGASVVLVASTHTFIMNSRTVQQDIARALTALEPGAPPAAP